MLPPAPPKKTEESSGLSLLPPPPKKEVSQPSIKAGNRLRTDSVQPEQAPTTEGLKQDIQGALTTPVKPINPFRGNFTPAAKEENKFGMQSPEKSRQVQRDSDVAVMEYENIKNKTKGLVEDLSFDPEKDAERKQIAETSPDQFGQMVRAEDKKAEETALAVQQQRLDKEARTFDQLPIEKEIDKLLINGPVTQPYPPQRPDEDFATWKEGYIQNERAQKDAFVDAATKDYFQYLKWIRPQDYDYEKSKYESIMAIPKEKWDEKQQKYIRDFRADAIAINARAVNTKLNDLEKTYNFDEYNRRMVEMGPEIDQLNAQIKTTAPDDPNYPALVQKAEQLQMFIDEVSQSTGVTDEAILEYGKLAGASKNLNRVYVYEKHKGDYSKVLDDEFSKEVTRRIEYEKGLKGEYGFGKFLHEAVGAFAGAMVSIPQNLKVWGDATGDTDYDAFDRMYDSIQYEKDIRTGGMFGDPTNEKDTYENLPFTSQIALTGGNAIGSMATFMLGGVAAGGLAKSFGASLTGVQLAQRAGTFTTAFLTTEPNYYQEARDAGMSMEEAAKSAAVLAALTAGAEMIVNDAAYVNGSSLVSSMGKLLKSTYTKGMSSKEATKLVGNAILQTVKSANKEGLEEVFQGDVESVTKEQINLQNSIEYFNTTYDAQARSRDYLGGFVAGGGMKAVMSSNSQHPDTEKVMLELARAQSLEVAAMYDPEILEMATPIITRLQENLQGLESHSNWNELSYDEQAHALALTNQISNIEEEKKKVEGVRLADKAKEDQVKALEEELNVMFDTEQQAKRDEYVKRVQEDREKLGVTEDMFTDMPSAVPFAVERMEAGQPVSESIRQKASDYLYNKYKELTAMKDDPKRMFTMDQIASMQTQLEADLTLLEGGKKPNLESAPKQETKPADSLQPATESKPKTEPVVAEDGSYTDEGGNTQYIPPLLPLPETAAQEDVSKKEEKIDVTEERVDALKDVESTAKALKTLDDEGELNKIYIEKEINVSDIAEESADGQNLYDAIENVKNGLKSQTKGKILVYESGGKYYIADGFHRVAEAKINGGETIQADVVYAKPKNVSEAYHKAKADGTNPELVKAVEDLLAPKTTTGTEAPVATKTGETVAPINLPPTVVEQGEDKKIRAKQIAEDYIDAQEKNKFTAEQQAIVDVGLSIKRDSFEEFGDKNNITSGLAKAYFSEGGLTVDQIATAASNELGKEVTTDDVIDLIMQYPNGLSERSSRAKELAKEYYELTGKNLTLNTARAALNNTKKTPKQERSNDKILTDSIDALSREGLTTEDGQIDAVKLKEIIEDKEFFTVFPLGLSESEYQNLKEYVQQSENNAGEGSIPIEPEQNVIEPAKPKGKNSAKAQAARERAEAIRKATGGTNMIAPKLYAAALDVYADLLDTFDTVSEAIKEFRKTKEYQALEQGDRDEIENEIAEPPTPTETQEFENNEGETKERGFVKQVRASKDISDETKSAFKDDRINYKELPNKVSVREANALIEAMGMEEATRLATSTSGDIPGAFRVAMAEILIKKYNEQGNYQAAVDIVQDIAEIGTNYGQAIQAFSLFKYLTPEGQVLMAQREVDRQRSERLNKPVHKKKTRDIKKAIDKANKEAVEETIKRTSGRIDETAVSMPPPPKREKSYGAKNKIVTKDKYEKARAALKTKMFAAVTPPPELIEVGIYHIEAGAREFSDFAKRMVEDFGAKIKDYLEATYDAATIELENRAKEEEIAQGLKDFGNLLSQRLPSPKAKVSRDEKLTELAKRLDELSGTDEYSKLKSEYDALKQAEKDQRKKELEGREAERSKERLAESWLKAKDLNEKRKKLREQKAEDLELERRQNEENDKKLKEVNDAYKAKKADEAAWIAAKDRHEKRKEEIKKKADEREIERRKQAESDAKLAEVNKALKEARAREQLATTERAITQGLKDLNLKIQDIIRDHYTVQDQVGKTLGQKLAQEAGLTGQEADRLAGIVEREFNRIATEKKQKAIQNLFSRKNRNKPEIKTLEKKLIELSNIGALDAATINDVYADALGFPKLTAENVQRIKTLAERVRDAKTERDQTRATEDLLKYQENIKGFSLLDATQAFWMSMILSNPKTQAINIIANAYNMASLYADAILQNPKSALFIGKGMAVGLKKGFFEGIDTWKTGYAPIRGKVEIPNVLERVKFKIPINSAKYVRRFMMGADTVFFEGLRQMRSFQMAQKMAEAENKVDPTINIRQRALEILNRGNGILEAAIDQAAVELEEQIQNIETSSMTAKEKKEAIKNAKFAERFRIYELVEKNRPEELMTEAHDYAARGTYNYRPEGVLGVLSDAMNALTRKLPVVRFIVPFVNVISNVANTLIDNSPAGAIGAYRGTGTIFNANKREMTEQQKVDAYVKAIKGTVIMALTYALTFAGDDDEEPVLEVTANGYGDFRKNQDLQAQGWKPYSYRVNGGPWISYKETPFALGLAYIGNQKDFEKYRKEKMNDTWYTKQGVAATGTVRMFFDATFLSSGEGFLGSLLDSRNENVGDDFTQGVNRVASSFVMPGLVSGTDQLVGDWLNTPEKEITDTYMGRIMKNIPVAKDKYFNKVNGLGEDITQQQDIIYSVNESGKSDKIWNLLVDKKTTTGAPSKKSAPPIIDEATEKERVMTDEEFYKFSKIRGSFVKAMLEQNYEEAKAMDEKDFEKWFTRVKSNGTTLAKVFIDEKFPKDVDYFEYIKDNYNYTPIQLYMTIPTDPMLPTGLEGKTKVDAIKAKVDAIKATIDQD